MLRAKPVILLFLVMLAGVIVIDAFNEICFLYYVGIVIVFLAVMVYGSVSIRSDFYLKSMCHGINGEKEIALTFDDGPHETGTPLILDILKKQNVKATFFIIGNLAERYPDIIRRIDEEGHILGGHSYSHHFFFDLFTAEKIKQELTKTEDIIEKITGKKIHYFRPPYGVTNPVVAKAVKWMNYLTIGWSVKSKDTVIKSSTVLLKRLKSETTTGSIMLFHDNRNVTAEVLEPFINHVKSVNFRIVPLDYITNTNAYVY